MATVVYRDGLNRDSYELDVEKRGYKFIIVKSYYMNNQIKKVTYSAGFNKLEDAQNRVDEISAESYAKDREFVSRYI